MKKNTWNLVLGLIILPLFVCGQAKTETDKIFDDAYFLWEDGKYIPSLEKMIYLLEGNSPDQYLDRIALRTGELYQVNELSVDGSSARFTQTGKYAIWNQIVEGKEMAFYQQLETGVSKSLEGRDLIIDEISEKGYFLRTSESPELLAAVDEVVRTRANFRTDRTSFIVANQNLNYIIGKNTRLMQLDLKSGRETAFHPNSMLISEFISTGDKLILIAAPSDDLANPAVYEWDGTSVKILAKPNGYLDRLQMMDNGALVANFTNNNPMPLAPGSDRVAPAISGKTFVYYNNKEYALDGVPSGVATQGGQILSFGRDGDQSVFYLAQLQNGEYVSEVVFQTSEIIGLPVLSPNGKYAAFEEKVQDDYEIMLLDIASNEITRVTREIQHDRLPQFVGSDHLLYIKGEPRHRRSFLYSVKDAREVKLFHNNTVRTIAPEYQWTADPSGNGLIIQSERDGNTITPERGLYHLDLTRKVSKADLLARLKTNLSIEKALLANGEKMYLPVRDQVAATVANVNVSRIYDYAKTLYSFDSKFVTRPGNLEAAEYIYSKFEEFGYSPEYQWFKPGNLQGFKDGLTANVIATLPGKVNPELVYIISSHYDSVDRGPGADDNTSGTTAMLEAARVMQGLELPFTVVFAAFTGEEAGLLGSREYVRRAVEDNLKIVGALNNDMLGWMNNQRLDNTIRYSNPGIKDMQHAAAMLFTDLITYDAVYYKSTDAQAYYDAYGDIVGGIGSYPVLGNPHYHQSTDKLETISHKLVAEVSKTTVATLILLASSPSRINGLEATNRQGGGLNATWQKSPESFVTDYIIEYENITGEIVRKITSEVEIELEDANDNAEIRVKARASNKTEGWDWARLLK
ncbi:M20/M25/M40 family metallo-hydrolase [Peijinzhouia sedimentorum]